MSVVGDVRAWGKVGSRFLERDREVWIWVPPGWKEGGKYPVLVLHDGRQVFEPETSTWGVDWGVDDVGQRMVEGGEVRPFVAVAVDCTEAREWEYAPDGGGEAYLRFLEEELVPRVEREFGGTGEKYVAGASMGGLISFMAEWRRPEFWAGAACLSPAFCGGWKEWAKGSIGSKFSKCGGGWGRFLVACGGKGELERELLAGTREVVGAMRAAGWGEDVLKVRWEEGEEHNEAAWAKLVPWILREFFGEKA